MQMTSKSLTDPIIRTVQKGSQHIKMTLKMETISKIKTTSDLDELKNEDKSKIQNNPKNEDNCRLVHALLKAPYSHVYCCLTYSPIISKQSRNIKSLKVPNNLSSPI